jgi:hypothetical protein
VPLQKNFLQSIFRSIFFFLINVCVVLKSNDFLLGSVINVFFSCCRKDGMDDDGDTSYLGANEMPVGSPNNCLGSSVVYPDFCIQIWNQIHVAYGQNFSKFTVKENIILKKRIAVYLSDSLKEGLSNSGEALSPIENAASSFFTSFYYGHGFSGSVSGSRSRIHSPHCFNSH